MAQYNQRNTISPATILDISQRTYHRRWTHLEGTRIVIPSKNQEAILNQIHDSHLGLNKCKLQAKQKVYWPGLNDQLEKLVLNCQLCLKYSNSKKKQETNLSLGHEIPLFPWTKLATDLFHF